MNPLHTELLARIRKRGPLTVAEFMDLALYHPEHGYYATAAQRSGRRGDFYTSVDVGPLFGELIAVQLDEMWTLLRSAGAERFDLVEAGAGNGRLARDILDAAAMHHPHLYDHTEVTLVERSAVARAAHRDTLGRHAERLAASSGKLPRSITGTILANELLDALPVHAVTMTATGLREIYVTERDAALIEIEGKPSDPAILRHLEQNGITIESGSRGEIGLAAIEWVEAAASALQRGFLLVFDYGHPAAALYSASHAVGTLVAYRGHTADAHHWLQDPGQCDLTAHVDLTAIQSAAEAAGLTALGIIDQTYFLLALGLTERLNEADDASTIARRLAAKTLIMPGGLGSTLKVMIFAKGLGRPALRGLSSGRLT